MVEWFRSDRTINSKKLVIPIQEQLHKKIYGTSISTVNKNVTTSIIENPDMLKIQQQHQMKKALEQKSNAGEKPPPPPLIRKDDPTTKGFTMISLEKLKQKVQDEATHLQNSCEDILSTCVEHKKSMNSLKFVVSLLRRGGGIPAVFRIFPLFV